MRGLDLAKERAEQSEKDWQFGASSIIGLAHIPLDKRDIFLPDGELQYGADDFADCASRSPHNALEAQLTWLYHNALISPENRDWLVDKGYTTANGRIELSDRFTSILSGTTRAGNSLKAPLESIRTNGVIPKRMLPANFSLTFEQYQDPSKITDEMLELGLEFTRRFKTNYEQVPNTEIVQALEKGLVGVALHAWPVVAHAFNSSFVGHCPESQRC